MEKKDIILLLLIIGSIITIIFGIDAVRLAYLLPLEEGGLRALMAVGVGVIVTIIFPILIIIFNILAMKALDENKTVGIIIGFITLGLCIITILVSILIIIAVGAVPGDGGITNIVMRMRGSLGVCIAAQILVLVGATLNLIDQFNK